MKRSVLLGAMAILIPALLSPALAQNIKDPKATSILKELSTKYNSLKSYSANFKVTTINQQNKTTSTQTGSLTVKGNRYRLTIKGQEVICDGQTVWTYLKESNEVQVNNVSEKSDAITPASIFTIYEKGFSSKYLSEKKEGTKTLQMIELVPDDQKKTYFKIQISIDKERKQLASAKIFDKNGSHYLYSIDKFQPNINTTDAGFTFDEAKYPGVEVIDLR